MVDVDKFSKGTRAFSILENAAEVSKSFLLYLPPAEGRREEKFKTFIDFYSNLLLSIIRQERTGLSSKLLHGKKNPFRTLSLMLKIYYMDEIPDTVRKGTTEGQLEELQKSAAAADGYLAYLAMPGHNKALEAIRGHPLVDENYVGFDLFFREIKKFFWISGRYLRGTIKTTREEYDYPARGIWEGNLEAVEDYLRIIPNSVALATDPDRKAEILKSLVRLYKAFKVTMEEASFEEVANGNIKEGGFRRKAKDIKKDIGGVFFR